MTREEFKAKVSMAYGGRDTWEDFLEVVWQLHLEASNHWIPVEERLPDEGQVVWIYTASGKAGIATYKNKEFNVSAILCQINVTNWMEIVPPRKED